MGANNRITKYTIELDPLPANHLRIISAIRNIPIKKLLAKYARQGIEQEALELNISGVIPQKGATNA